MFVCRTSSNHLIMIKLSSKVVFFWLLKVVIRSFKMQENTSLRPQNFKIFRGSMPPDPPSGQGPRGLPILCPGVKLSCLLDENLNEPPENYKEGRGKKPKIQECLNSQEIRKFNKVKKQNKTNKNK